MSLWDNIDRGLDSVGRLADTALDVYIRKEESEQVATPPDGAPERSYDGTDVPWRQPAPQPMLAGVNLPLGGVLTLVVLGGLVWYASRS